MTLSLEHAAQLAPNEPALITDEHTWTWKTLLDFAHRRRERYLRTLGCNVHELRGLPVTRVARSDPSTIADILTLLDAGARLTLLHDRLPLARKREQLQQAFTQLHIDGDDISAPRLPLPEDELEPWSLLIFTSGSSAQPKGVRLSVANLQAAATASATNLGWLPSDRWLLSMPLGHIGGLSVISRCVQALRPMVLSRTSMPRAIEEHRVTLLSLVPTQLQRLIEHPPAAPHALRACIVGGAAATPELIARARQAGIPALPSWGMSETAAQIATQALDSALSLQPQDLVGVGQLLPGIELQIDDTGQARLRGAQVFEGYLGDGHNAFDSEGFFAAGDRVELRNGSLHILGRPGDFIISGGENVSLLQVHNALMGSGLVQELFVTGITSEEWGARAAAAFVPAGDTRQSDLERWAREHLPAWERPARWLELEALPLNANGKVDAALLRQKLGQPKQ